MSSEDLENRALNLLNKSSNDNGDNKDNQSAARYWVFTQFNYKTNYEWYDPCIVNAPKGKQPLEKVPEIISIEEGIQRFATNFCSYLIYGREKATEKLTEHLQGCFVLRERKTFNYIKTNTNKKIHLEKMDKCLLANIIYCKKEHDYWEHCDKKFNIPKPPNKKKFTTHKERCENAIEKAKKGKLLEIDADLLISNLKNLQQIQYLHLNESVQLDLHLGSKFGNYFKNHFIWIKGKTGTLKSYNAHKIAECLYIFMLKYCEKHNLPKPNAEIWGIPYIKDLNKWYQNYKWQKVMLIEEVQPDFCKNNLSRFKRWFDQYAYPAEFKGGDVGLIRPEFIIITSNYSMDECFIQEGIDLEKDYAPMKRRILEITVDKMSYIIWPNHKLLNIEYNSKETIINYEKQFIENVLTIQGHNDNSTFENTIITDPNIIEKTISEFEYVIDLKNALIPKPNTKLDKPSTSNNQESQEKPSFIIVDNNEDLYQTPKKKRKIDIIIPETPVKKQKRNKSLSPNLDSPTKPVLERQNAILIDSQDYKPKEIMCIDCNKFTATIENPFCAFCDFIINENPGKTEQPICRTCKKHFDSITNGHCSFCTYNLMKSYNVNHPNTFKIKETQIISEPPSPETNDVPPNTPSFKSLSDDDLINILNNAKNELNQDVPQLSNSQETQQNTNFIPQFDGADDFLYDYNGKDHQPNNKKRKIDTSFKDENGNTWKSIKQKKFIESKIKECQDINKTVIQLKSEIKHVTDFMINKNKQTQIELLTLKKQKIIKEFKLDQYNWIDDDTYTDPNICHYCNRGVINQCSCFPVYVKNLPFNTIQEKMVWRDRIIQGLEIIKPYNKKIKELVNKINNKNTSLSDLEILCNELNWQNTLRNQSIKNYKLQNVLPNKIYPTKCDYCNLDCKRICECSGNLIFYDENGKAYQENKSKWPVDNDETFDQWQEQDHHSDEF